MTNPSATPISLPAHTRRHLGRHLAALYDSLPPAPLGPRLATSLRQLQEADTGPAPGPAR